MPRYQGKQGKEAGSYDQDRTGSLLTADSTRSLLKCLGVAMLYIETASDLAQLAGFL